MFIGRVRALEQYHAWDDRLVLFAAQLKLRRSAKRWHDLSRVLHQTMEEFEGQLLATFPDLMTVADVHEQMVTATRAKDEGLQNFCHRIVAIAQQGNLPEATVVLYILKIILHTNRHSS